MLYAYMYVHIIVYVTHTCRSILFRIMPYIGEQCCVYVHVYIHIYVYYVYTQQYYILTYVGIYTCITQYMYIRIYYTYYMHNIYVSTTMYVHT